MTYLRRFTLGLVACCLVLPLANAEPQNVNLASTPPSLVPPAPNIDAKGYVVMDANTGTIIAEKNIDKHMEPASLTKLMTLYLTFQALNSGQIHLDDQARISTKAWRMGGSRMFLKEGSNVPVELLIQGIIVASGNDACVATAQFIAGTEQTFAQMMNQTAKRLGMKSSHYVDSTGLPHSKHYTTPRDMAILTRALIHDYPQNYHFFKQKWLTYNHIKQPNRNRLLWRDSTVDGLKTGHTKKAGYCLISSAKRNGMRLIAVVMGTPTDNARANDSQSLLNYGFRFYKTHQIFPNNKSITQQRVWLGQRKYVDFGVQDPLYVTLPTGQYQNIKASMNVHQHLRAPIIKGQSYGQINITANNKVISTTPLVALENDAKGGIWTKTHDHITLFFKGLF